jgi:hypothetical protein
MQFSLVFQGQPIPEIPRLSCLYLCVAGIALPPQSEKHKLREGLDQLILMRGYLGRVTLAEDPSSLTTRKLP